MVVLPFGRVVVLAGGLWNCSFQVPLQQMQYLGCCWHRGWQITVPRVDAALMLRSGAFAWREMLRRGYRTGTEKQKTLYFSL